MAKSQLWTLVFGLGLATGYVAGQAELIPAASADEPAAAPPRGKGKTKQVKADALFRQKVRAAVAKELADLAALKKDFADHHHTFSEANYGHTTLETLENCDDCLLPFLSQHAATNPSTTATSGPQQPSSGLGPG